VGMERATPCETNKAKQQSCNLIMRVPGSFSFSATRSKRSTSGHGTCNTLQAQVRGSKYSSCVV
jgi:hypothetical protein